MFINSMIIKSGQVELSFRVSKIFFSMKASFIYCTYLKWDFLKTLKGNC